MILFWLIVALLAGGVFAAIAARWNSALARWIALASTLIDFALVLFLWVRHAGQITLLNSTAWLEQIDWIWISQLGIHFHLALDGLSLLLLALTFFIGALSILASWTEVTESVGFFHLNVLWTLAGHCHTEQMRF